MNIIQAANTMKTGTEFQVTTQTIGGVEKRVVWFGSDLQTVLNLDKGTEVYLGKTNDKVYVSKTPTDLSPYKVTLQGDDHNKQLWAKSATLTSVLPASVVRGGNKVFTTESSNTVYVKV